MDIILYAVDKLIDAKEGEKPPFYHFGCSKAGSINFGTDDGDVEITFGSLEAAIAQVRELLKLLERVQAEAMEDKNDE